MCYRFLLAFMASFCLLGQVCALDEDAYASSEDVLHTVNVNESVYNDIEGMMLYDENDLSYEQDLNEDDGVKMNYEMPPLNRQYKGSVDKYYKEFEM